MSLELRPEPVGIVRRLASHGHEAYIVGGAIRDLLLGLQPKDYDITTSASPEQIRKIFGRGACHIIGRRFRLAQVFAGDDIYEVSTFRREPSAEERKGRYDDDGVMIWNDNAYGTLEDDAKRRDFTVNALYLDCVGSQGILDYCHGLQDLKDGIVRSIGAPNLRIEEDPVRLIRALKLVGQYGFTLTPELDRAIRSHVALIRNASASRLFEELLKIFFTGKSASILQVMHDYGLLEHFWPYAARQWRTEAGQAMQTLLALRDAYMAEPGHSMSKAWALAVPTLPYVMEALSGSLTLWEPTDPVAKLQTVTEILHLVYGGYNLPRFLMLRMREFLLMLPDLASSKTASRWFHHKEWKYARLSYILLSKCFQWDPKPLEALPTPEEAALLQPAPAPRRRRRRPRRRFSRKTAPSTPITASHEQDSQP